MANSYYTFLCACLRADSQTAGQLSQIPNWGWERLFDEANQHCVLPAVGVALRDGIDIPAPDGVKDFLSAVVSLNRQRNERIWAEVESAARALNTVGIEPVLLKGAAYYAAGVYSDPGERYLGDVDLLVAQRDLNKAVSLLKGEGFVQEESDRFGRFRHHHPPLRRPGSVWFELHHTLVTGRFRGLLPADEILAKALPCRFGDSRVRVPCPEHLAVHLILHSQIQHPYNERIWPPLRAVYDMEKLQRHFGESINWPSIGERFRAAGAYGAFVLHLRDVREALGAGIPAPIGLSGLTRLRAYRRRLLRRWPRLRYVDPVYVFATTCTRRLRLLGQALRTPAEWKYLLSQSNDSGVYLRFLRDLVDGRGR